MRPMARACTVCSLAGCRRARTSCQTKAATQYRAVKPKMILVPREVALMATAARAQRASSPFHQVFLVTEEKTFRQYQMVKGAVRAMMHPTSLAA